MALVFLQNKLLARGAELTLQFFGSQARGLGFRCSEAPDDRTMVRYTLAL